MSKKVIHLYRNRVRVNSPQGVNRLLQRVINALLDGEISESKARAIGYLCNIILRGLEVGELEERLSALEAMFEKEAKAT
jgi:hypothetical protein